MMLVMQANFIWTRALGGITELPCHRSWIRLRLLLAIGLICLCGPENLRAQQPSGGDVVEQQRSPDAETSRTSNAGLQFNFAGSDWRNVLEWFSDQANLSLQLDQVPMGTFSFADPTKTYSISESLDILNLSLMKRGYSLVRRGRLLQVIDLEAENADKLISEIAELVTPDELDSRGKSDIVSSVFPLGAMTSQSAKEELAQLIGPWGRVVVLESARQIKVTETATKLIAIRDLLRAAAIAETEVTEIVLQHRSADELLEIARPLLGLQPDENSNDDIRISIGPLADRIYAIGSPGKTGLLKSLIQKADAPVGSDSADGEETVLPVLRTHPISSADTTTVFDVLQTLLAGSPDARIAIDPRTKSIVARARPEIQDLIEKSIAELEGNGQDFKIFELKRLDPAQALLTINKFFGVTAEGGEGPIVDGDPATGKLWVRGTSDQIEKVQQLISELESSDSIGGMSDKVRILPYTGRSAQEALTQAKNLWPITGRTNAIRELAPSGGSMNKDTRFGNAIPERRVFRPGDKSDSSGSDVPWQQRRKPAKRPLIESRDAPSVPQSIGEAIEARQVPATGYTLVSENNSITPNDDKTQQPQTSIGSPSSFPGSESSINVQGSDIVIQMTPAGILIASEDTEALQAFEELLRSIAAPEAITSDVPTIYWLKYAEAEMAAELVSKVLGGTESSLGGAIDSVASGLGGGMLGGLIGLGGGGGDKDASASKSVLTSSGSVSIVPDARLNALIVQANPTDLRMIEMILEKIDRADSPEDVQTKGRPALIPVVYQDAADVAKVVKEVLGDRIEGQSGQSSGNNSRGRQPSPRDFFNALRGGGGGGGADKKAASEPSKISIAVDAKSNSLVVVATPADYAAVRDLVQQIDESGMTAEETVMTYTLGGNMNPEVMRTALESILGVDTETTKPDSSTGKSSGKSTAGSANGSESSRNNAGGNSADRSAAELRQRADFFRALRGAGGRGGQRNNSQRGGGQRGGGQRGGGR
jgi:type II secretory pathway component GspD/PulD (secretin)